MIAICSAYGMLYNLKILFTCSLKFFLSSLHLSSASRLNVGCFIMGLPSLGPAFCVLSAPATVMACIAALVSSVTACAIASLVFVCSISIIYVTGTKMGLEMKQRHFILSVKWLIGMDAGRYADDCQQFVCTCAVVFLPK